MGAGSFLATVRNPIQYPDDWDDYTYEKKLEWLKNRSYWHEYYDLSVSHHEYVKSKFVEDNSNSIYYEIINSIVEREGDKDEAEELFVGYINKKYMLKPFDINIEREIKMEIDRINECIRQNYVSMPQRELEYYYFDYSYFNFTKDFNI